MTKPFRLIEYVMLALFFGFVPVLFFLLITVVIASALFGTKVLGPWTLWSFVPAIAIDATLMKKWLRAAYRMSGVTLGILYLFYSIVGLGMCMGIPLVSFTLGIAAGLYAARRMQIVKADEKTGKINFKKTAFFSAAVMGLMCLLITLWAVVGQVIGYKLQTPLLSFTFTVPIFIAVVLTGTAAAVLLQYLVTLTAAKRMSRLLSLSSVA